MTLPKTAWVIGCGLIGGSVCLNLKQAGYKVHVSDIDEKIERGALERGVCDSIGENPESEIVFICTPLSGVVDQANRALNTVGKDAVVTDVAGVKSEIMQKIKDPRFVGGHPMAGSEKHGLDGAIADMFKNAPWILCVNALTATTSYEKLKNLLSRDFGAEVISMSAERHDELIGLISHVPHLLASALMRRAIFKQSEDSALFSLAAGGFKDMTRIAAGSPNIWPDIAVSNQGNIISELKGLMDDISHLIRLLERKDTNKIRDILTESSAARRKLMPVSTDGPPLELRVLISDSPGSLAKVIDIASDYKINIKDLEIEHLIAGEKGVLVLYLSEEDRNALYEILKERDFTVSLS
jgi:prephenate dehydrogenase